MVLGGLVLTPCRPVAVPRGGRHSRGRVLVGQLELAVYSQRRKLDREPLHPTVLTYVYPVTLSSTTKTV